MSLRPLVSALSLCAAACASAGPAPPDEVPRPPALESSPLLPADLEIGEEPVRREALREVSLTDPRLVGLTLEGFDGPIVVRAAPGPPRVVGHLATLAATEATAEAALAALAFEVARSPEGAGTVRLARPPPTAPYVTDSRYEVFLPNGFTVSAFIPRGEIEVYGPLSGVRVGTGIGDVHAELLRGGNAIIETLSGKASLRDFDGGTLAVTTASGAVELADVQARSLAVKTSSGKILVRDARASEVAIESSAGSLELIKVSGNVTARTEAGPVAVADLAGERIELRTGGGKVRALRVQAALDVATVSGDLELRELSGSLTADTRAGAVEVNGSLAALTVISGSGDVRVAGTRTSTSHTWRVSTGSGELVLSLDDPLACQLDAASTYGRVYSELPVATPAGMRREGSLLQGPIGRGGARIELRAGSGNVTIRRR